MIYNTVAYIESKFGDLNDLLCHLEALDRDLLETIKEIKVLYITLCGFIDVFNEIFGWPLVFIHFYWMVLLENCLLFFSQTVMLNEDSLRLVLIAAFQIVILPTVSYELSKSLNS